ncbi:hypothetical protein [Halorarius halobius]|uniref:hypothetical protein n=1 Tax=Halorarius halobius TaxID=2962671 RepID=UPI0020CD6BAC|nr:hypothetical protein [Halorarius halobius]
MREFTKHLDQPVNLQRLLTEQGIEFLNVNETRLIVLYQGEVIQLTVANGEMSNAQILRGRIWETPQSSTDDWEEFINRFTDRLGEYLEQRSGDEANEPRDSK